MTRFDQANIMDEDIQGRRAVAAKEIRDRLCAYLNGNG